MSVGRNTMMQYVVTRNLLMMFCGLGFVAGQVNPGFQIRLSQTGLNYGASIAVDILARSASQMNIPDQRGSASTPVGQVSYDITNMQVNSFIKPGTDVIINPGSGLTWNLYNAGIYLSGDWHYVYYVGFITVEDSGTFDGDVLGASLSVSVTLGQDPSGHPTITSTGCQCNINSINIYLHGGASWLYNLFIEEVVEPLRFSLQQQICAIATRAIDENARDELATLPVEITIDNQWDFDYRLVSQPSFQSQVMDTEHKGEFFFEGDTTEAPYRASPFPQQASDRMITLWASDYILNTIGYVLYKHNILKYNLTKNDLPADEKGFLNTTCNSFECFGFLIPQAAQAFPNSSVEIEMFVSSYPTGTISSAGIKGNFAGIMSYNARLSNGSIAPMFKTQVTVVATVMVSLNDMILRGNVTKLVPTVKVVESEIGPIPDLVLNAVFNLASKFFLLLKLNEIGQKGIPIPTIEDVQFINTVLETEDHCVRISTDVRYSPSTVLRFAPKEK